MMGNINDTSLLNAVRDGLVALGFDVNTTLTRALVNKYADVGRLSIVNGVLMMDGQTFVS